MAASSGSGETGLVVIRWTARISASLLVALVLTIVIGEGIMGDGLPNPLKQPISVNIESLAFLIAFVGLIAGWWREGLGGGLVLGGLVLLNLVELVMHGHFAGGAFPYIFIPGILYMTCFVIEARRRKAENI